MLKNPHSHNYSIICYVHHTEEIYLVHGIMNERKSLRGLISCSSNGTECSFIYMYPSSYSESLSYQWSWRGCDVYLVCIAVPSLPHAWLGESVLHSIKCGQTCTTAFCSPQLFLCCDTLPPNKISKMCGVKAQDREDGDGGQWWTGLSYTTTNNMCGLYPLHWKRFNPPGKALLYRPISYFTILTPLSVVLLQDNGSCLNVNPSFL